MVVSSMLPRTGMLTPCHTQKDDVQAQARKLVAVAQQFRGVDAGEENGYRGYFLTFMIAYLRDFGIQFSFIAESFETVSMSPVECLENFGFSFEKVSMSPVECLENVGTACPLLHVC